MRHPHLLLVAIFAAQPLAAQGGRASTPLGESRQLLDTAFVPPHLGPPTFSKSAGPLVLIDEAHHNFHTASGRYRPFAKLLESDGFRVGGNRAPFTAEALKDARVLVIANALDASHLRQPDWKLPAASALSRDEISHVAEWVRNGGSLLLIADHMPFAGDAAALTNAFGIRALNSFALLGEADPRTGDYPIVFRRSDGTLKAHPITDGRRASERIDSVESFTGSAFGFAAGGGEGLMALPARTRVRSPAVAWQFDRSTPEVSGASLFQGGVIKFGKGRVAMFGEAAMFTAQRKGVERVAMGMNSDAASQNPQFILNVMHWLAGVLP
jgi:hypothetical protein